MFSFLGLVLFVNVWIFVENCCIVVCDYCNWCVGDFLKELYLIEGRGIGILIMCWVMECNGFLFL